MLKEDFKIHQVVASLTKVLLNTKVLKAKSSTFSWPLHQQTKVVFFQRISLCLRMIRTFQRLTSNTWLSHCVTSTSTGQARSKYQLLASMPTRSQSSTWRLELLRSVLRTTHKDAAEKPCRWEANARRMLFHSTTSSTSSEWVVPIPTLKLWRVRSVIIKCHSETCYKL